MRLIKFTTLFFLAITSVINAQNSKFTLADFHTYNTDLNDEVMKHFNRLSAGEKVAQLIMPAIGAYGQTEATIDQLVKDKKIGGILLLNGTKTEFTTWVKKYNSWNMEMGTLPYLYSADAEASLVNRKIKNSTPVAKANTLKTIKEVTEVATTISKDLNEIGINYNFAPVVDMSPNKTVGWRSFGHEPDSVIPWSDAFIQETQKHNIIATAKHFPGHGYVEGDTHKKLVYIKGEMKEVKNYPTLIENGVVSIMIAHIAVENETSFSTNGMPASISKEIVTDLLRDSLQFEGLIVTDAMNMLGVSTIPGSNVKAIDAGVDILLMPLNAAKAHSEILEKYINNEAFKAKVDESCKRIIRAKLCTEGDLFPN
ncbi:glycoside hydrolase family 3 N-terminal domain-containing protein [Brumimicrobium mesophilum]|uniref:glycoside hydrolase family 3 N-terminal domain-containing protein n=1 Tax=Brumimicrobium mesophilum TaxID=392717 RepID=UPI000D13F773|nr:glycoside hydrolase family 3 N-terminal domain-containing protein [Brumimicrobium mesophilum]